MAEPLQVAHDLDCVIIGAGCSGTLTAFHLARIAEASGNATGSGLRCAIVDPNAAGPGLPYATQSPLHVLNVPAGRMSAVGGEAEHFLQWCRRHDGSEPATLAGGDFVTRRVFGNYLRSLAADARSRLGMRHVESRAIRLGQTAAGVEVECESGERLRAKHAVLAWGHGVPRIPAGIDASAREHAGFVNNPWATTFDIERLARGVLLIGTGLTMVDCAMMIAERAPECRMTGVSRRGLLPQPHRHHDAPPQKLPPPPIAYWPTSTRGITRAVRAYVRSCQSRGWDWREAITALRPVTSQLWGGLSHAERQRFLERLVPYWDSHRHRAAPQVAARIDHLQTSGVLEVMAARVVSVRAESSDLRVTLLPRGEGQETSRTFGYVVNCTGPEGDLAARDNPLVKNLLKDGLVVRDELRLGLEADAEGHPISAEGETLARLWTIGPLRKAQLWETIAVPEIRVQAEEVARKIHALITADA